MNKKEHYAVLPVVMEVSPSKNNVIPRNFIVNGSRGQVGNFCLGVVNKMSASTIYGACADWNACITISHAGFLQPLVSQDFSECPNVRTYLLAERVFHSISYFKAPIHCQKSDKMCLQ